ncbi:MAG: hypothetical protein HOA38_03990 [Candidatus Marinimicrobia bacterium]|jgi:hypothetical protein|nr:hypothetical protein [Candidatus Neomarinimicrobiota bacterium]
MKIINDRVRLIGLLLILTLASGCSTMQPPRYSISVDNIQIMKSFNGVKAKVAYFNQGGKFDSNCRLMGPIEPADNLSFSKFITKAFNDEFKMAGIFSEEGARITGNIIHIEFSSITGLTSGYWDISIVLKNRAGKILSIRNKYKFKSGFDAITACNATADALTPAVQDLIKASVSHPEFEKLLEIKE